MGNRFFVYDIITSRKQSRTKTIVCAKFPGLNIKQRQLKKHYIIFNYIANINIKNITFEQCFRLETIKMVMKKFCSKFCLQSNTKCLNNPVLINSLPDQGFVVFELLVVFYFFTIDYNYILIITNFIFKYDYN